MRHFRALLLITAFVSLASLSGGLAARIGSASRGISARGSQAFAYRSRTEKHKVLVDSRDEALRNTLISEGASVIEDYGGFSLLSVPSSSADGIAAKSATGATIRDDLNLITLRAGAFDTTDRAGSAR